MYKVVAAAVGLAAGVFTLGAALAASPSRRESRGGPTPDRIPPSPPRDHRAPYAPDGSAPFGPYHGARRPPGLPLFVAVASGTGGVITVDGIDEAGARAEAVRAFGEHFKMTPSAVRIRPIRRASARGAAVRPVADQAASHGHGEAFVKTITHLAKTEGEGGTFAVPARTFNAACMTRALDRSRLCTVVDAPRGERKLITAWGVFQWNRDAGRALHALDGLGLRAPAIASDWMPWDWTAAEEIAIPINYYAQLWRYSQKLWIDA